MSEDGIRLLGVVGSTRAASVNGVFAAAAAELDLGGAILTLHDPAPVPLYNGDDEEAGPPAAVVDLIDAVAAADGLVLFSPEYNGSFPAVTKNVIDWLSRPPKRAWEGKPLTMVTASPGPRAGAALRGHFEAIMGFQPVRLFETIGFGGYGDRMTDGRLTDTETLDELGVFLTRFAAFCAEEPPAE